MSNNELQDLLGKAEANEIAAKRRAFIYSILPILLASLLLYYFILKIDESRIELHNLKSELIELKQNNDKLQQQNIELEKQNNKLQQQNIELEKQNNKLQDDVKSIQQIYDNLHYLAEKDFGWNEKDVLNPTPLKIKNSKLAHKEILDLIIAKKVNVDLNIRYYAKKTDKGKVDETLKKCGYRRILIFTSSYDSGSPTNSIYFSPRIDIDNVKLIAYSLIRAGIDIKVIKPYSKRIRAKKPNSIEICGDKNNLNLKSITLEDIKAATEFY